MSLYPQSVLAIGLLSLSSASFAGLIGTDLQLSTLQQATASSAQFNSSFPRIATVGATTVEFPDVFSLFNPLDPRPPGFGSLVNTSIDAGNDYIEIDFDGIFSNGVFASAFQNTYVFTFTSTALATIAGALIDTSVTTLGLTAQDVTFQGNRLFVNVESLPFNRSTFARINLTVLGGPTPPTPVPEPHTFALLLLSLPLALALAASRRRVKQRLFGGASASY